MDERKECIFFRSYYEAARLLTSKEEQADFLLAICQYSLDGKLSELTGAPAAVFTAIKPTLDKSRERAKAGKKGGSVTHSDKDLTETNDKQTEAKPKQKRSKRETIKDKGSYEDKGSFEEKEEKEKEVERFEEYLEKMEES